MNQRKQQLSQSLDKMPQGITRSSLMKFAETAEGSMQTILPRFDRNGFGYEIKLQSNPEKKMLTCRMEEILGISTLHGVKIRSRQVACALFSTSSMKKPISNVFSFRAEMHPKNENKWIFPLNETNPFVVSFDDDCYLVMEAVVEIMLSSKMKPVMFCCGWTKFLLTKTTPFKKMTGFLMGGTCMEPAPLSIANIANASTLKQLKKSGQKCVIQVGRYTDSILSPEEVARLPVNMILSSPILPLLSVFQGLVEKSACDGEILNLQETDNWGTHAAVCSDDYVVLEFLNILHDAPFVAGASSYYLEMLRRKKHTAEEKELLLRDCLARCLGIGAYYGLGTNPETRRGEIISLIHKDPLRRLNTNDAARSKPFSVDDVAYGIYHITNRKNLTRTCLP